MLVAKRYWKKELKLLITAIILTNISSDMKKNHVGVDDSSNY